MKGLAEKISKYLEEKKMSQRQFATAAAVNAAFVSQILNGKPVSEVVERKVSAFLEGRKVSGLMETKDFRKALKYLRLAQAQSLLVGLTGDTGIGKTTALKHYARRQNVFYIRADKSLTAKQMVYDLAQELGIGGAGTVAGTLRACCKRLNKLEKPLVLVDECGKIKPLQLMYLQEIRDNTEAGCGMVLAGMPYFKDRLYEGAEKRREGFAEMLTRVQLWVELNGLTQDEIREVLQSEGIEATEDRLKYTLFRSLKGEIMMSKAERGDFDAPELERAETRADEMPTAKMREAVNTLAV